MKLEAFAIDPNSENMEISLVSTWSVLISADQHQDATIWEFVLPTNNHWILVIGILSFDRGDSNLSVLERTATCYLWAKKNSNL